jgi:hypothetical protein
MFIYGNAILSGTKILISFFLYFLKTSWHNEYNNLNTSRLIKHQARNTSERGLNVSSQHHASSTLTPRKSHGSHWIEGCVSLCVWENSKTFNFNNPVIGLPATMS